MIPIPIPIPGIGGTLDERFPNVPDAVIYGTLKDQVYTHFEFANTSQHMTECFRCSAVFDTGKQVASELLHHGQILCFDTEVNATSSEQVVDPASAPLITSISTSGRDELFASVSDISSLVGCGVIGMDWVRMTRRRAAGTACQGTKDNKPGGTSDVIKKCTFWTGLVASSQKLYKPQNIKQLLP